MDTINKKEIGKPKIYLKLGETVKREKLLHALFPKNAYSKIMEEARRVGIRNTFSAFTYENVSLLQQANYTGFALYASLSFVLGLIAVVLGLSVIKIC